ncbi:hypothetical protein H6A16_06955, partial [Collinsella tanakaei]|uniref:hypothetical protein n=1 Tax=Collinsella tanakaei TaxID=626935 RepID=UPI00195C13DB
MVDMLHGCIGARAAVCAALAAALVCPGAAFALPDPGEAGPAYTGWVDAGGEPCAPAGAAGWVDAGGPAESKFFYDPATDAWYWAEADGSIARDHDAFVPRDNGV